MVQNTSGSSAALRHFEHHTFNWQPRGKEYAELFRKAGLELDAIHPTPSPISVIEAVKA